MIRRPARISQSKNPWEFRLHRNPAASKRATHPIDALMSASGGHQAYEEIRAWAGYQPTPLRSLDGAATRCGVRCVLFKDEASRLGLGSFKALGGSYAVAKLLQQKLSAMAGRNIPLAAIDRPDYADLVKNTTFTCASDGNHGLAVAAGARRFGSGCVVFLHEGVSMHREQAIRNQGAMVIRTAGNYDRSVIAAKNASLLHGWQLIADTSTEDQDPVVATIMRGYMTLMIETLQQLRSAQRALPTHVFLQGGVGGLAGAVIAHLCEELGDDHPTFIIVEPMSADCLYQSAIHSRPTPTSGDLNTLMAGLSCGEVSRPAWPVIHAGAEFFVAIQDEAAAETVRLLHSGALGELLECGESGAAGLAGLLAITADPAGPSKRKLRLDESSVVLTIGTEGVTDPTVFQSLVATMGHLSSGK